MLYLSEEMEGRGERMTYDEIMKKVTTLRLNATNIVHLLPDKNFKWILSRDVLHTIEGELFNMVAYRDLINKRMLMGYPIEDYHGKDKNVIRLVWEVK